MVKTCSFRNSGSLLHSFAKRKLCQQNSDLVNAPIPNQESLRKLNSLHWKLLNRDYFQFHSGHTEDICFSSIKLTINLPTAILSFRWNQQLWINFTLYNGIVWRTSVFGLDLNLKMARPVTGFHCWRLFLGMAIRYGIYYMVFMSTAASRFYVLVCEILIVIIYNSNDILFLLWCPTS